MNVYLVEDVIDLPLIARKFNVDSLHMKANHAASQQMISVTANFNLHTKGIENFSMNVVYKQRFIEEITFLESAERQNIDVFSIYSLKTASD